MDSSCNQYHAYPDLPLYTSIQSGAATTDQMGRLRYFNYTLGRGWVLLIRSLFSRAQSTGFVLLIGL